MIEYVSRSGPPEAMNCPAFICDACREQVVGPGNILWSVRIERVGNDVEREVSPMFVAHKGKCDRAVKELVGRLYPLNSGWCPGWSEIRAVLDQLTHNLTHAFTDDCDGTYHDHDLIQPAGTALPNLRRP